ncbi:MAG: channel protein TolC [Methylococcaceae bacterium]|jgi:outer membrane protein|nr:MAG: channel protein TolC [Methylococcaceae bacterium]
MKKIMRVTWLVMCCASWTVNAQDLLELYELALQNNPQLKQAYANQLAVSEITNISLANFLPSISAVGQGMGNQLSNQRATYQGSGFQQYVDNSLTVNLLQPVFHWEHWLQLSQAENQLAQAEAAYHAELQTLMVKVVEAYFNVLSAEDNVMFYHIEQQAIARQVEQAKQRFALGFVEVTEVREAQAAFDQVMASVTAAEALVENQKEALIEIIGEQTLVLLPLQPIIPLVKPHPESIEEWSKTSEVSNFKIISAFNQVEVARKTVDLQRNGHLPKLDVVASYGEFDTTSSFGLRGNTQNIGLKLSIPMYEGGAVNAKIRQANHKLVETQEVLVAVKRAVNRQVKEAYRGMTTSISQVLAFTTAVKSSELALEATQAGYEVGTRTLVDVLTEQRNVYRAKRDLSRARYDYLVNGVKLKQAASSLTQLDVEQLNHLLQPAGQ